MGDWLYIAGAVLGTLLFAWLVLSRRPRTLDVEPVSPHWLAENKRSSNDDAR
jgi:hypothetical protein